MATLDMGTPKIILHLTVRTLPGCGEEFVHFLQKAVPFYEEMPGVKVRLLSDLNDPDSFIEVIEYEDHTVYESDQARVQKDPTMKQYLSKWRLLLKEAPHVRAFADHTYRLALT